jgi:hypothetical protein
MRMVMVAAGIALIAGGSAGVVRAEVPRVDWADFSTSAGRGDVAILDGAARPVAGFVRSVQAQPPDPCLSRETVASPTRPNWDSSAMTTPCGDVETDFGLQLQPMGGGVRQAQMVSSMRIGITPHLDVRWGVINHITQTGGDTGHLAGIGDQMLSTIYRFHDPGRWTPALAFSYGVNLPTANPQKGFGSGYINHLFVLISSRDLGKVHLDMNAVGTLTGGADGHDGAVQCGLAVTRPVTRKLSWVVESYGGPQPGTSDRFGAALTGGSYMLRPWLVLDGALSWTYTAGSPRKQVLFGFTYARRPGLVLVRNGSRIGRLLGR